MSIPVSEARNPDLVPQPAADTSTAGRDSVDSSASWLTTICVLSLLNSVAAWFELDLAFFFGLGVTQLVDGIGIALAADHPAHALPARVVTALIAVSFSLLFLLFGSQTKKRREWALVCAILLWIGDSGLMALAEDGVGVLFHAWALYVLCRGYTALRRELARQRTRLTAPPADAAPALDDFAKAA
jgi:hypothetical protein